MNLKDTVFYRVYYNENRQEYYTDVCSSFNEAIKLLENIQTNNPEASDFYIVKETIIKEFVLGTVTI